MHLKIKRLLSIIVFLIIGLQLNAQESDSINTEKVYTIVDEPPQYPGGMTAFYKKIADNLRYPLEARIRHIDGKLYLQFVVDETGNLTNIKTVKGIGGGCDKEAERVLALVDNFIPGKQNGKPVKVKMIMPIAFKLPPYDPKINADTSLLNSEELFTVVDSPPKFPGGTDGFDQFVSSNSSKRHGLPYDSKKISVFTQFTIEKDGSTTDLKVIKGDEEAINNEAIRILNLLPNFSPGIQRGTPVRVRLICNLTFELLPEKRLNVTGYIGQNTQSGLVVNPNPVPRYSTKNIEDSDPAITKLKWSNRDLRVIPASIAKYKLLWFVDFENNNINYLPSELFTLKKLRELYLPINQIDEIPDEIGTLKNLRIFSISNNNLQSVPESLAVLKKLTALDLGFNKLNEFPMSILALEKLETLILSGNNITQIPFELSQMPSLQKVYLEECPIDIDTLTEFVRQFPKVEFIF